MSVDQYSTVSFPDFEPALVDEAAKDCLPPNGRVLLSVFGAYREDGFLYGHDNLNKARKDSRLHKLEEEFPEFRPYVSEYLSKPPVFSFQVSPVDRLRENLLEKGVEEHLVEKACKCYNDLGLLEPYAHQQSKTFGEGRVSRSIYQPNGLDEIPPLQAELDSYKSECQNVVLDKFHKQYPCLAFRYPASKNDEDWIFKVLRLQKLGAKTGCSLFAAHSGSLTFNFQTQSEAEALVSSIKITEPAAECMKMSSLQFCYNSAEELIRSKYHLLWESESRVSRANNGAWVLDVDESYIARIPYVGLVLIEETDQALFPFLMLTASNPMGVVSGISSLREKHEFAVVHCEKTVISLVTECTNCLLKTLLKDIKKVFPSWHLDVRHLNIESKTGAVKISMWAPNS